MPRDRCHVKATVASREGAGEAAIHGFAPGPLWWLQPICKGTPDTDLKDGELTVQNALIPFYGHRDTRWDPDQDLRGSWPFSRSDVNTSHGTKQNRASRLASLSKSRLQGACFGQSFPDWFPWGHGLF